MKKILVLLLCVLPFLGFSQNDSWFKLEVQFDYYADDESFALITQQGDTLVNYQPSNPFEFYSTVIQADSGELDISLLDSWGDGWQGGPQNNNANTPAWIKLSNECQGVILDLDVDSLGNFTQYDTTVNLLPCPPPVCAITNTNAYQQCLGGEQALVVWEWDNGWCEPVNVKYWNEEGWGPFYQGVPPYATNYGMLAGNGQMPPNWSVEHYLQVEFSDGTLSDTITYTPTPCIEGCTDSSQISYNPWATADDGSCAGNAGCDSLTEYPITMEITLDNWPSETSWIMNSGGVIGSVQPGEYGYNDIGQTYIYNFCVSQTAGFELILNDTYGDGMVGTQTSGPGSVVIKDCAGDTIWEMTTPNFGNVLYSGPQQASACPVIPDVYGCTDPAYQEYSDSANVDDGSCANLHIYGCMDTNSINYNPNATQQSIVPVCDYFLTIEDAAGDGWGNSYLGVAQNGVPVGTFTMGPGSYEQTFQFQLETDKTVEVFYFEVGSPQSSPQQVQFQTWHNSFTLENADSVVLLQEGQNPFANNGQGALQPFEAPFYEKYVATPFCGDSCVPIVYGCTDPTSLNYNPDANTLDPNDPCIPNIPGCMNPLAFNYDSTATVDDGSCIPVITGCMDSTAFNYDPTANTPGTCIPVVLGCTDPTSFNYDPNANTDDSSCVPIIYGCTDVTSFNYDPNANTDDGSCIPAVYGCTDPGSFNYNPNANINQVSANDTSNPCIPIVYGCTDPQAFNYDPNANTDNGSCEPIIYGCTDSTSFNYDPLANTDNGSCVPFIYGCMDPGSFNYDPNANVNQVSATDFTNPCIPIVYGCTDSTAVNYDPNANVDNGSCITAVVGCTDPNAFNYDPNANVSDSSACLYDAGCITGPGNPYWLNNNCYAWVIDVDNYCCDNDWDPVCQEMYNYCENGWPDGLDINSRFTRFNGIVVYPNPTENILIIETDLDIEAELYDINGRSLKSKITEKQIDFSDLPSGVYFLNIKHEGNTYFKRIIKE
tara:strand:- start:7769 stop:10753 length:2985 start_codon:yes stop_codon:yes gene_type:complete